MSFVSVAKDLTSSSESCARKARFESKTSNKISKIIQHKGLTQQGTCTTYRIERFVVQMFKWLRALLHEKGHERR